MTLKALIATAIIATTLPTTAIAQSAPSLSGETYRLGQKLSISRGEAVATAANAEQRRLALRMQNAQVRLMEAEARAAAMPRMHFETGGPTPMVFSMLTGNGLLPGGDGETNYHVNIQVGEGNTSNISSHQVQSSSDDKTPSAATDQN